MMLYIMRHGVAEARSAQVEDSKRKLTVRSREKVRDAAGGMRALKLGLDRIITSPLPRAAETAEIVAAEFSGNPAPEPLPALGAGAAAAEIASALRGILADSNALVVGHEPSLSRLASLLLTGSGESMRIRLKQGGCIALEFAQGFGRGGAELRWMLTQRQLRRLRK